MVGIITLGKGFQTNNIVQVLDSEGRGIVLSLSRYKVSVISEKPIQLEDSVRILKGGQFNLIAFDLLDAETMQRSKKPVYFLIHMGDESYLVPLDHPDLNTPSVEVTFV